MLIPSIDLMGGKKSFNSFRSSKKALEFDASTGMDRPLP